MKKIISILLCLALVLGCAAAPAETAEKTELGKVTLNGKFTIKGNIPEGFTMTDALADTEGHITEEGMQIFLIFLPEGEGVLMTLTVGLQDDWPEGIKFNDVSAEDLAQIEESFYEYDPGCEISYTETGLGTKLLQAVVEDKTEAIFYSLYEGYEIELSILSTSDEITQEQLAAGIQFLTDMDFITPEA
jgi:hypothetical protein